MKTNITRGCIGIFVVAAILSFLLVGKLIFTTDVSPKQFLFGEELELKNVYVPELYKKDSYTIESGLGKEIDYIFVRFADEEGNHSYNAYTPAKELYSKHEAKHWYDKESSFLQIISSAYADHNCPTYRVVCSGSHIDSQGNFHADGCWCR